MTATETQHRPLYRIAEEIHSDWKNINYAAQPYWEAMLTLDQITEDYYFDTGKSIVRYFLSNAQTWRGETARRVKKELNAML
jgi:hypothetical protein